MLTNKHNCEMTRKHETKLQGLAVSEIRAQSKFQLSFHYCNTI